jgi:hypothetical protein
MEASTKKVTYTGFEGINVSLEAALSILNPETRAKKRHISKQYSELGPTIPVPLTESDRAHFKLEWTKYNTYVHVKTDTERGREIARAYLLPPYMPYIDGWIDAQMKYTSSLSPRETFILRAYSYHGDRLVNRYLRDERSDATGLLEAMISESHIALASIPFKYQIYDHYNKLQKYGIKLPSRDKIRSMEDTAYVSIVKENLPLFANLDVMLLLSKAFYEDLMRIFMKAPRLPHSIVTYRGITSEKHVKGFEFRSSDFQSTSLNPGSAAVFTQQFPLRKRVLDRLPIDIRLAYADYWTNPKNAEEALDNYFKLLLQIQKYGLLDCCLYEIIVDKSVPCIYMDGITLLEEEFELLLPPGIDVKLDDTIDIRRLIYLNPHYEGDLLAGYLTLAKEALNERLRGSDDTLIKLGSDSEWAAKTIEQKIAFLKENFTNKLSKFPDYTRRIAVTRAFVTSPYYSHTPSRGARLVHNAESVGKTRKAKKGTHEFALEKQEKAHARRELQREKTRRKKGRRGSVANNNGAVSFPYKKPSSSSASSSSSSSSSSASSTNPSSST